MNVEGFTVVNLEPSASSSGSPETEPEMEPRWRAD
jgi:hypothetical protein